MEVIKANDTIIKNQINNAQKIVIMSHIRPDGDAIGSALAFANALNEAGKQTQVVLQDGIKENFLFLPGANEVVNRVSLDFDYLIVVDCSDRQRVGTILEGLPKPNLVVDHHKTHDGFGEIDYVEAEAEATALMLVEKLTDWGLEVSKETATCLMVGLLTDTLGFRTNSVTPKALRVAADLMEKGVDLARVYHQSLVTKSYAELRYWGQGLSKLEQFNQVLTSTLTLNDRIVAGYPNSDDADLINALAVVPEALVTIVFVEQELGNVKVSWRSVKGLDVSQIANNFGGGGHASAAGADIPGKLGEVKDKVLKATHQYLKNKGYE